MSIFTSLVQKTLTVPGDDAYSIVIRRLAPKHLEAARAVTYRQSLKSMRQLYDEAGKDVVEQIQKATSDGSAADAVNADPLIAFDAVTLIEAGVVSWTYDAPLTRDSFEDIDADIQHWLATEILKLTKPSLYQTDDEQRDDRKS